MLLLIIINDLIASSIIIN